ncbi:MAG: hypothetical protein ACREMN_03010 [Gemmatimonadales bacterium]
MSLRHCAGAALVLLSLACARSRDVTVQRGEGQGAGAGAGDVGDTLFVEVINDNYYDARIHLVYDGGAPYSLGTVPGNQSVPLQSVPWQPRPLVVEISLVIAGGTYRSDRIDVAPGDVLQIRVPADLQDSGFFRRVAR